MSVVSGLGQMLSQLEEAFTNEKNRLEQNVEGVVKDMARNTKEEFDNIFSHIKDFMGDQVSAVKEDFSMIEKLFDDVKDKVENTAVSAFNTFTKKTEEEVKRIQDLASGAISKLENATEYIRTKAMEEIRSAINKAREDFNKIKDGFKNEILAISSAIVDKTRNAIGTIKSAAESDLGKLNDFRKSVDDEIVEKFNDVKDIFIKIKDGAKNELDTISNFVIKAVEGLEARISALKKEISGISTYLSIAALLVGFASALIIISEKEKRATLKIKQK